MASSKKVIIIRQQQQQSLLTDKIFLQDIECALSSLSLKYTADEKLNDHPHKVG